MLRLSRAHEGAMPGLSLAAGTGRKSAATRHQPSVSAVYHPKRWSPGSKFPIINATLDADAIEIVRETAVKFAAAAETPNIVPVQQNAVGCINVEVAGGGTASGTAKRAAASGQPTFVTNRTWRAGDAVIASGVRSPVSRVGAVVRDGGSA